MTADEYRAALKRLGLTQAGASRLLGVSDRTGQTYAITGPSGPAARVMQALEFMTPEQRAEFIVCPSA
jgi:hypothetical protein